MDLTSTTLERIARLNLKIEVPQLERWMLDVMRDVRCATNMCKAGTADYKLRITPYRTLENKIDGVVLTLLDISELLGPAAGKTNGRSEAEEK